MQPENEPLLPEEGLDPQDWSAMRSLGHRMVDDIFDYWQSVRERPVWQPVPDAVKANLERPLPLEPQAPDQVYQDFVDNVLPYPMGNIHPRFWGWVIGTGTPLGALAEFLGAALNPNMGGGDHGPNYVEAQVIEWIKQMLSFPQSASGLLVSGASEANLNGLTVARDAMAGFDVHSKGVQSAPKRMVLYASSEVHSCIERAVDVLGLGCEALHLIPVDQNYEMDLRALKDAIAADRRLGFQPFCVVGTAGTVNTGAIDNLQALADLCQEERLWFHVDGAIGSVLALSPNQRERVRGMQRADSLALDLHKWMYIPYEAGCSLVANSEAHRRAFAEHPDYLARAHGGLAGGSHWFSDYGIQLSRGFRALKVWMSFKEHGIHKYGRMVDQNIAQAKYLVRLIEQTPGLELLAPAPLNIVCFRYKADGLNVAELNRLNQELLVHLHESGIAAPSYTTLSGVYALRVANTNQRSRREDFDLLVQAVVRLGRELEKEFELSNGVR
jgi:glutamate/tyrosine decarboxylase-like PLP-dependent enzyme